MNLVLRYDIIHGKRILFENNNSLFHTLRQSDPSIELIRENVAAAMNSNEIHKDVHEFFIKLTNLVIDKTK